MPSPGSCIPPSPKGSTPQPPAAADAGAAGWIGELIDTLSARPPLLSKPRWPDGSAVLCCACGAEQAGCSVKEPCATARGGGSGGVEGWVYRNGWGAAPEAGKGAGNRWCGQVGRLG